MSGRCKACALLRVKLQDVLAAAELHRADDMRAAVELHFFAHLGQSVERQAPGGDELRVLIRVIDARHLTTDGTRSPQRSQR